MKKTERVSDIICRQKGFLFNFPWIFKKDVCVCMSVLAVEGKRAIPLPAHCPHGHNSEG